MTTRCPYHPTKKGHVSPVDAQAQVADWEKRGRLALAHCCDRCGRWVVVVRPNRTGGLARSKPMRQVSSARKAENAERRQVVEALVNERGPECEAKVSGVCTGWAQDPHEILARSAGGSITDPSNILGVCRACHEWIGRHPVEATELGLRASRYEERT